MATGYTWPVVDGTITTFPEFAKNCMRAFGATIHMRDEPTDAEYHPREVSGYHKEQIERYKKERDELIAKTDEEILSSEKNRLSDLISDYRKSSDELKVKTERIQLMIDSVEKWIPPTTEHEGFKKFMLEQLETSKSSGHSSYYEEIISEIKERVSSVNPGLIRSERLNEINTSLKYHEEEYKKEVDRVASSNKWVQDLLTSLNK